MFIFAFNVVDFIFNLFVERKIDGCLIKSLKESVLIYLKHWMIVDVMSMIGMIISFHRRDIFFINTDKILLKITIICIKLFIPKL